MTLMKVYIQVGHGDLVKYGEGTIRDIASAPDSAIRLLRESADRIAVSQQAEDKEVLDAFGDI